MRRALDKYVFRYAQLINQEHGGVPARPGEAKQIIGEFASSPSRRDSMLRKLGFIV
jgi:hypothetical protein